MSRTDLRRPHEHTPGPYPRGVWVYPDELTPEYCARGISELIPLGSEPGNESLRKLLLAVNRLQLQRRFPSWQVLEAMSAAAERESGE